MDELRIVKLFGLDPEVWTVTAMRQSRWRTRWSATCSMLPTPQPRSSPAAKMPGIGPASAARGRIGHQRIGYAAAKLPDELRMAMPAGLHEWRPSPAQVAVLFARAEGVRQEMAESFPQWAQAEEEWYRAGMPDSPFATLSEEPRSCPD